MISTSRQLSLIRAAMPALSIDTYVVNNEGWDNTVLIVNGHVLFRFPKRKEVALKLHAETRLLSRLKERNLPIQVPSPTLFRIEGHPFMMYERIKGEPLKSIHLLHGDDQETIARKIGEFLTLLHSMTTDHFSLENTTEHSIPYWIDLKDRVVSLKHPLLTPKDKAAISTFFANFIENSFPSTRTLLHGDLSSSHLLFDGTLTGVIDFTDAQLGDPAFDFAGLYYDYGESFTKKVISYYYLGNDEDIYNRVSHFYGIQPIFHELLYFSAKGNEYSLQQAILRIKKDLKSFY